MVSSRVDRYWPIVVSWQRQQFSRFSSEADIREPRWQNWIYEYA
jgi:hypothetical protein